ncbi:MAG: hypothetical protein Q9181_004974 [Wetmoreana brouardii]
MSVDLLMPQTLLPDQPCSGSVVVIISTRNPDGSVNLALISNIRQLGVHCVFVLNTEWQISHNLLVEKECVINVPSQQLAPAATRLVRTTDSRDFATSYKKSGYRYVRAKYAEAGFTPWRSKKVAVAGVKECSIRVEAKLVATHQLSYKGFVRVELQILRTNADGTGLKTSDNQEVEKESWEPLTTNALDLHLAQDDVHLAQEENESIWSSSILDRGLETLRSIYQAHQDRTATNDVQTVRHEDALEPSLKQIIKMRASPAQGVRTAASPSVASLQAVFESSDAVRTDNSGVCKVVSVEDVSATPSVDLQRQSAGFGLLSVQLLVAALAVRCLLFLSFNT